MECAVNKKAPCHLGSIPDSHTYKLIIFKYSWRTEKNLRDRLPVSSANSNYVRYMYMYYVILFSKWEIIQAVFCTIIRVWGYSRMLINIHDTKLHDIPYIHNSFKHWNSSDLFVLKSFPGFTAFSLVKIIPRQLWLSYMELQFFGGILWNFTDNIFLI